jgi:phosphatidylserine decarboxylase
MPTALKEWVRTDVAAFQKKSLVQAAHNDFFRDPPRVMWQNRDFFAAPADGVITTLGRYDPEADLIDVKGAKITTNSLLGPHAIDSPALVVCIFMTFCDCHINRAATDCTAVRYPLPPIRTSNAPMLWAEHGLLDEAKVLKADMGFMATNGRVVTKCYCGPLRYTYWLVQIADSDVSAIVPFVNGRVQLWNQNQRIGMIRWGSMCCLILPLDPRYRFKPLAKLTEHVEATEPLVSVNRS